MTFLMVDHLTHAYGDGDPVLSDFTVHVEREEIFALLGPSGSGKTTALRLIAGFERADAGRIFLDEDILDSDARFVPPEQRRIGVVFQEFALFPHLNVLDNIRFGLRGMKPEPAKRRTLEMLQAVQMGALAGRMPQELSGGQQQRVALARALAPHPRLLLMDEAFGSLDPTLRAETREQTRAVLRDQKMTAILVTHDQEEAMSFADRIGIIRDGVVEQVGTPEELYANPRNRFVAQFLGGTNVITGVAERDRLIGPLGSIPLDRPAEGRATVSLRAEDLALVDAGQGVEGVVLERRYFGHDLVFRVRVGELEVDVRSQPRCPYASGDTVGIEVQGPAIVLEE